MSTNHKASQLAQWLNKISQTAADVVPKDFNTVAAMAADSGLSVRRVREMLAIGIADGAVEVRDYRIKNGRRVCPVPHYGPAKCKR